MGGSPSRSSYNCDDLTDRIIPASASFGLAIVSETLQGSHRFSSSEYKAMPIMNSVIDADGRVFEIEESWDTYADPAYGDRWPRDRNAARVRFLR
jgi:hypothetical protein